jgi:hypothetical protein
MIDGILVCIVFFFLFFLFYLSLSVFVLLIILALFFLYSSSPYPLSSPLSFSSQHGLMHGSGELQETSAKSLSDLIR